MFRYFIYILFFIALLSFACQKKKKIIFFGDSLTELAVKPGGFITILDSFSNSAGKDFEFIGSGVSGNKINDLYYRLEKDVLSKDPQVVVIFIGINDVWHKKLFGTGTDPGSFQKFYQEIINKLKAQGIKIFLCTPTVIGERRDDSNELDKDLDLYSRIISDLAKKNKLSLIDLRKNILTYLKNHNRDNKEKDILTYDKVHLNTAGNEFVANVIWESLKNLPAPAN